MGEKERGKMKEVEEGRERGREDSNVCTILVSLPGLDWTRLAVRDTPPESDVPRFTVLASLGKMQRCLPD